jgi:hypothetical protein
MTDKSKGHGRRPLPVDPRLIDALDRTYRDGSIGEIPIFDSDETGDITALVREIRRAGAHAFPDLSTRIKKPEKKRGIIAFFLREKNPRLSRRRDDDTTH